MKNVKKFFKLLCFVFVMFFMIGIGGVNAASETVTVKGIYWLNPFYVHKTTGGTYAFCLNSRRPSPQGGKLMYLTTNNGTYNSKSATIKSIVKTAVEKYGFNLSGTGNTYNFTSGGQNYSMGEYDFYGAIQVALWKSGVSYYTPKYASWANATAARRAMMSELTNDSNISGSKVYAIYAIPNGDSRVVTRDGDYLVSIEYTVGSVNIPSGKKVTLSVDSSSSANSEIYYNGTWSTSATVNVGDRYKVRIKVPEGTSEGELYAKVNLTTESFVYDYDVNFYSSRLNVQDMAIVTPKTKTVSSSQGFKGSYSNETLVSVQKIDARSEKKVAGARLGIYKEDGTAIKTDIVSTAEGRDNEQISLPAGNYYLKEEEAPIGYVLSDEKVYFSIDSSLNVLDSESNVIQSATIAIDDERETIRVRKVDENGDPVEGVRIEIGNWSDRYVGEFDKEDYLVVCGITDNNGYVTQPCTEEGYENYSNLAGYYILDRANKQGSALIYYVKESNFKDGYHNEALDDNKMDFAFNDYQFLTLNSNVQFDESTLTLVISNQRYIDISKVDITNGAEIAGAELHVYDKSGRTQDDLDYFELDSWTSEAGKTHRIEGIEANHRYILSETLAPEGYIRITSNIEFEMDENGKVTTYDAEGESLVLKDSEGNNINTTDYKLVIPNSYTKTVFSKVSAVEGGKEIAGAHLKVCSKAGYDAAKQATGDGNNCEAFIHPITKEKVEWISEEGKTKTIEALPAGTYYFVEELAPEGYVKQVNSVEFVVKDDGTITPVKMVNEPTKVVISKKDISNGEEIPGATIKICTLTSFEADGADCKPDKDEWSWTSGTEPKEIDLLPLGDYVLIETLPAPDYQEGMIINGELMTAYKFSITADDYNIKIDVYNQILTDVPKTGISTLNLFAIGGLMVFVGYETIKIYRKKVNA